VLQSIVLLPKYSFCPFSSTLSPCLHLLLPSSLNLSPDHTFLLHTHHLLTNLLYQLYTTPTHCIPWHKAPYTTTTEIHSKTHKGHKTQQPHITSPTHPTSCLHF
jgi:hypothetical protein